MMGRKIGIFPIWAQGCNIKIIKEYFLNALYDWKQHINTEWPLLKKMASKWCLADLYNFNINLQRSKANTKNSNGNSIFWSINNTVSFLWIGSTFPKPVNQTYIDLICQLQCQTPQVYFHHFKRNHSLHVKTYSKIWPSIFLGDLFLEYSKPYHISKLFGSA